MSDHSYTPLPICPYCGYAHNDSWEWRGDEDGEKECDSCGESFLWTRHVSVDWSTKRTTGGEG